ncbi:retinoic acid receptor responder protein 2 [Nannospalax galili]|uniref:Retinoic acid receptor responder protein 2 n=1 Tax=Nannospalax galili TaxID=1026970 RepID=A0A8C6RXA7_NANGA|nr:retinoic acid receptor responder protein 2 [Nannospalax galili]XP_008832008.1 retinoic acid receptor responder protein 2 [Nannospalax galili]XP_008832009.1 retinoic acid receptor responder protein 2 [Nannospalax galili]XP_029419765.1 retinoic acid receptor responder protein 2 [Nannospalax galili]
MKHLLISLALWLGTVGVGGTELTETQHRGLQVALELFHEHPPLHWAFQETGVDSAEDTPFPAGTFVKLEFKLQQTNCLKKDWRKPECKVKPNGRKRKCLACIKLDPKGKVLSRMIHCPILKQGPQDLQESRCSKVAQAGEDPHSYFFPGQFAFSRSELHN